MNELDWLQEVYKDYCSKHDLDHVSTCEQSGLTPEQWKWIDQFNNYWDEAQNKRAINKIYALVHQYDYEDSETGYDVTKNEKVSFYESKEDAEKHLRNLKRGLVFHRDYRNWLIKHKGQWNQHIFKLFRLYLPYEQKDVQGPVSPEVFNQIEDQEVNKSPTVSSCSPLFGTFERERSLRCWHPEATEQDDIPVDFIRFNDEDDGIKNEIVYIEEIPLFKGL